jgi:cation diffusion facilitator CzcD-associated flavoprotein CzcO
MKRWKLENLIQFNSTCTDCIWDDDAKNWTVKFQVGPNKEVETYKGRHLILATGCLSCPQVPKFPGIEEYKGDVYHTGQWPKEGVDFTGKTVAVIGTGSSALQSIPIIAQQAKQLTVFQRTAVGWFGAGWFGLVEFFAHRFFRLGPSFNFKLNPSHQPQPFPFVSTSLDVRCAGS